jgi:hypothetical protein
MKPAAVWQERLSVREEGAGPPLFIYISGPSNLTLTFPHLCVHTQSYFTNTILLVSL